MPGDAREIAGLADADLGQRLGRRDDFHKPPVLQHQRIAMAQHHGFRQVEQEFKAPDARHDGAAAVALVEIEHDGIGGLGVPCASGADEIGADHGVSLRKPRVSRSF